MGILAYVLLWHGLWVFGTVSNYLPLVLPLAVTVLSIFPRATELRSYEAVLKVSNDIAIGIISFDIWALSASRSDSAGRILVNKDVMIQGDFVLPFLLSGLFVALGCAVLTNYSHSFKNDQTRRRWLEGAFAASVLVYLAPFGLIQPIPPPTEVVARTAELRPYTVVVPYQDPGIIGFAPSFLKDRLLVRFERSVVATDQADARAKGIDRFLGSPEALQVKSTNRSKVLISKDDVLVIPQPQ